MTAPIALHDIEESLHGSNGPQWHWRRPFRAGQPDPLQIVIGWGPDWRTAPWASRPGQY